MSVVVRALLNKKKTLYPAPVHTSEPEDCDYLQAEK
jgi:hypothetical protein